MAKLLKSEIPPGYSLWCTSYWKPFSQAELDEMRDNSNKSWAKSMKDCAKKRAKGLSDYVLPPRTVEDLIQTRSGLLYARINRSPAVIDQAVIDQAEYQEIMKDPKLKSIVRQLKEIDDEEEWWLLAESLRAFCSRKEIDLIDTVNGWNIND